MSTLTLQRNFGLTGDLFIIVGSGGGGTPPVNEDWTDITPSADSRVIYCSNSGGLDTNDGLTELTPKKTLSAASSLYRHGFPDHCLLKSGDEWPLEQIIVKGGRSDDERAVLSSYGAGDRPAIDDIRWTLGGGAQPRSFFNYIGIEFKSYKMIPGGPYYDPLKESDSKSVNDNSQNVLFEDCKWNYCQLNYSDGVANMAIRRCIFHGAYYNQSSYSSSKRPSSFHSGGFTGYLTIEDSIMDHGGWNSEIEGAAANIYNHNIYMSYTATANSILLRNNIFTRGSSHGTQMRLGGTVDNNFYSENANSFLFGSSQGGPYPVLPISRRIRAIKFSPSAY